MRGRRSWLHALEQLEGRTLLSVGDLDSAFAGGIAVQDLLGGGDFGFAVAVQSDGKVVLAGRAWGGATGNDFALVRFNSNGTLDTSFGSGGYVLTDLGSAADGAYAVAVQADGMIVVAGETFRSGTLNDLAIVRYNADGSRDSTFGSQGIAIVDVGGGTDQAAALAVTSSGGIVVAGWASVGGSPTFALTKLTTAGQLDVGFGADSNGKVTTAYTGGYARGMSLALLSNGQILVGGSAYVAAEDKTHAAVARYSAAGVLDSSFGVNGLAIADLGADQESASSIAVQPDGKIVLAGQHDNYTTGASDFAVARLLANGALDASFGTGGVALTDFDADYDMAAAVALQSDGRIVVSGLAWYGGQSSFGVARYNADGTPDASFAGGKVAFASGVEAVANAVTIDSDGNILVGGFQSSDFSNYDVAVARVVGRTNVGPVANAGGPYTVAADGSVTLNGGGSVDPDGSIVGYEWDYNYDGSAFDVDATGATPTFSATGLSDTTRTIAVRVIDNDGAISLATTTLTVNPLPPPPPPPTPTPTPSAVQLVDDPRAPGKKQLIVNGTSKNDTIVFVRTSNGQIEVRMNGRKLGRYSSISRVVAYGSNGNDVISTKEICVPAEFFGGRGNDHLSGTKFSDILVGGDGNDHLFGLKGDDFIVGGSGSDRLHSVWGNDILVANALTFENDLDALRTVLSQWTLRSPTTVLERSVIEDKAKDTIYGTPGPDWILAGPKDKVCKIKAR